MTNRLILIIAFIAFAATARAEEPARSAPSVPLVNWADAGKFVGQDVTVQGRIVQARNIGALCFLNFDSARSFTAIVRKENFKNFAKSPDQLYGGKLVQIRGRIGIFRGKPELEVKSPDAVRLIEREEPVSGPPATQPARVFDGIVRVATYNVLNLFDEYDDPYREDEGTPKKPDDQLRCLAGSIRALNADVLCLQEVENRDVLESFTRTMLMDMSYREVISFESNDARGIECGVLSRFPVGPVTSHRFRDFDDGAGGKARFRRDLLQVRIEPPGCGSFDVFVVHLKSKRGDATSSNKDRMAEAHAIQTVLGGILKANSAARFLICGDFNDTWNSPTIKTLIGDGPGKLVDFLADLPPNAKSYNQPPHAEMIDFIFCSSALARTYVPKSYRIVEGSIATTGSDHNPVFAEFDLRPSASVDVPPASDASTQESAGKSPTEQKDGLDRGHEVP